MEIANKTPALGGTNAAKTSTVPLRNSSQPSNVKAQLRRSKRQAKRERKQQQQQNSMEQMLIQGQNQLHNKLDNIIRLQQLTGNLTQQTRDDAREGQQESFNRFETAFEFLVDESRRMREDHAEIKKQLAELTEQSALQAGITKDVIDALKLMKQAQEGNLTGESNSLPKKRGRPPKQKSVEGLSIDPGLTVASKTVNTAQPTVGKTVDNPEPLSAVQSKKRGRPRKRPLSEVDSISINSADQQVDHDALVPKKRGRPSKAAKLAQQADVASSTIGDNEHNTEVLMSFVAARAQTSIADYATQTPEDGVGKNDPSLTKPLSPTNIVPESQADDHEDSQSDAPLAERRRGHGLATQTMPSNVHRQRLEADLVGSPNDVRHSTPKNTVSQRADTVGSGVVRYNVRNSAGRWMKVDGTTALPPSHSQADKGGESEPTTEESDIDMDIEDDHESDNGVNDLTDDDHYHDFEQAGGVVAGYQQISKQSADPAAEIEHDSSATVSQDLIVVSPAPTQPRDGAEDAGLGAAWPSIEAASASIGLEPSVKNKVLVNAVPSFDFSFKQSQQNRASQGLVEVPSTQLGFGTPAEAQALQIHEMLNNQERNSQALESVSGSQDGDSRRSSLNKPSLSQDCEAAAKLQPSASFGALPRAGHRTETAMMWPSSSRLPPTVPVTGSFMLPEGAMSAKMDT